MCPWRQKPGATPAAVARFGAADRRRVRAARVVERAATATPWRGSTARPPAPVGGGPEQPRAPALSARPRLLARFFRSAIRPGWATNAAPAPAPPRNARAPATGPARRMNRGRGRTDTLCPGRERRCPGLYRGADPPPGAGTRGRQAGKTPALRSVQWRDFQALHGPGWADKKLQRSGPTARRRYSPAPAELRQAGTTGCGSVYSFASGAISSTLIWRGPSASVRSIGPVTVPAPMGAPGVISASRKRPGFNP